MKKRIFTIFLVILIAVTNMTVCYATSYTASDLSEVGLDNSNDYDWNPTEQDATFIGKVENVGDTASGIIKTVMNILTWPLTQGKTLLIQLLAQVIPMMDSVVFNDGLWGQVTKLTFFDSYKSPGFPYSIAGQMQKYVSIIYQTFRYIAMMGFIVAIAVIAVKMILSSVGKKKQQYKDMLKNWLIGLVLLIVGHWIMIYMIYISSALVDLIKDISQTFTSTSTVILTNAFIFGSNGTLYTEFSHAIMDTAASFSIISILINSLVNIFVIIIFIAMNLKIFKVYLERVIVVAVLIMLFPLVTVFYAFESAGLKRGATLNTWLNVFVSQVFIQPVHALALTFVIVILKAFGSIQFGSYMSLFAIPIVGPIFIIMVVNLVFKCEEYIKRVFAINGPSMGMPVRAGHEVGRLARGATNMGIAGFNMGRNISNARAYDVNGNLDRNKTKALRRAAVKDEAINMAKRLGRKSGINIGDLGLIESRNVAGKMRATVKSGNINPAHIPEFTSKLIANGDPHEKLAKFGIKNISEFENLARANDFRAMLVIQEEVEPGSTDKYLNRDKNGNVMYGSVRSDAQDLYNKSKVSSAQRKNDIKKMGQGTVSDAGKDALQVALQLDDQENYDRFCSMLGKTDVEKNNFDFTDDELQAMAYCVNEGIDLSEVMRNGKVDMTLVNPPKASARRSDSRTFVTSGFRKDSSGKPISSEVFKMQKVAQSYDKEDKANVDNILAHTNITRSQWDDFKDTGNMNGFTEEDLRTAIYYLDDITNVPAGFDQNVMSERELKHAYYDVPETDIISSLKGVVNAGTAFDSIGFDNTTADAFEVYTDRYDSSFGAALATTNADYTKSYTKDDVRRIVRDGKNAKEADVKFVRGLIKHMIKKA